MGIELAKAYLKVGADTSELPADLNAAKGNYFDFLGEVALGAAAVLAPINSFLGNLLSGGIKAAGEFEQTFVSMETMTGSAEETEETLAGLTDFAAKTPFEMPGILSIANQMITFGERGDELMDTMGLLADASGGTAPKFQLLGNVFNQVRGVGKLMTQDFRQLSTQGILSLTDIADHFGTTTEEAQEKLSNGSISFDDFRNVMKGLTEEGGRFYQMAEKQSQTLIGLQSTLTDAWDINGRILASSVVPAMKTLLNVKIAIVEFMGELINKNPQMASGMIVGAKAAAGLGTALFTAAGGFFLATKAAKLFGIGLRGVLIGSGFGIAIVLVGAALGAMVGYFSSLEQGTTAYTVVSESLVIVWENLKEAGLILWETFGELVEEVLGVTLPDAANLGADSVLTMIENVSGWMIDVSNSIIDAANILAFNFRNASELAQIAMIDFALYLIDFFAMSNTEVTTTGGIFVGMWKAVGAFFKSWVTNIIGGLKEIKQFGEALWTSMEAGMDALWSGGNPFEAMQDAFIETLSAQEDVESGGNPFSEMVKAYKEGKDEFVDEMNEEGGGTSALLAEKKRLQDLIAANELERSNLKKKDKEQKKDKKKDEEKKKDKGGVDALLDAGRFGFEAFGTKLQDAVLKGKGDDQQAKMVDLLGKGNETQKKLLDETKKKKGALGK